MQSRYDDRELRTPHDLLSIGCCIGADPRLTHGFNRKPWSKRKQEGPYGIRTRAAAVRGRCPRPLDEWAL
jgi:hypothetical protein